MENETERGLTFLRPLRFAKRVDLSRAKIYSMIAAGELKAVKLGGALRIPSTELDRLAAEAQRSSVED